MTKSYTANTDISINIVLPKGNMHISFNVMSNGKSKFTTDNEEIQNGIEHHYNFGKLFRLIEEPEIVEPAKTEENADVQHEENTENTDEAKIVYVSDLASAKDYLADTFGISRTALKTRAAILEHAQQHGITFEGLRTI